MKAHSRKRTRSAAAAFGIAGLCAGAIFGTVEPLAQEQAEELELGVGARSSIDVLRSVRDALVTAADFIAAREPADQIVTDLDQAGTGPTANDLLNLARIQAELKELDAAEVNYLRAIELLEAAGGEYSPTLVAPYHALGRTYINGRRFAEAITVLEQARHITQRSAGLFNVEQSEIMDDITMAHLGEGNTLEARSLQLQRLDNALRRFGADDPRVVPFHTHLGDYFDSSRLRVSAREQYAKALEIQQANLESGGAELLPTLRKLVAIDMLLGDGPENRESLATLVANSPEADAIERALSWATLGDWATVQEDASAARDYYQRAYAAASENGNEAADALFAEPKMIDFIPPLSSVDRAARSRPYAWGSIELEFDLSADGRAYDVATVSADPPTMESAYNRRIRETHFRPRLDRGEPVPMSGVRFNHFFRYYVTEKD